MPSPTDTHQCLPCEQSLTQPSVFDGLCRDYVSQLGRQSLDELHDTTGAVHNDGFRLDQGMLGHVGILSPDNPDGHEDGLDLDDTYQHEDWHRMRLLWVLGAEVDRLRHQLAELEAVTSAEMRQMTSEHRQACQELDANRDGSFAASRSRSRSWSRRTARRCGTSRSPTPVPGTWRPSPARGRSTGTGPQGTTPHRHLLGVPRRLGRRLGGHHPLTVTSSPRVVRRAQPGAMTRLRRRQSIASLLNGVGRRSRPSQSVWRKRGHAPSCSRSRSPTTRCRRPHQPPSASCTPWPGSPRSRSLVRSSPSPTAPTPKMPAR
jgi:hypothetical protein